MAAEKMLAIQRLSSLGNVDREIVASVQWLARLDAEREDFTTAREACQEVLELEMSCTGPEIGG